MNVVECRGITAAHRRQTQAADTLCTCRSAQAVNRRLSTENSQEGGGGGAGVHGHPHPPGHGCITKEAQKRLDRRLEEVAQSVGGVQMPW